jgi:hypothetical protein
MILLQQEKANIREGWAQWLLLKRHARKKWRWYKQFKRLKVNCQGKSNKGRFLCLPLHFLNVRIWEKPYNLTSSGSFPVVPPHRLQHLLCSCLCEWCECVRVHRPAVVSIIVILLYGREITFARLVIFKSMRLFTAFGSKAVPFHYIVYVGSVFTACMIPTRIPLQTSVSFPCWWRHSSPDP